MLSGAAAEIVSLALLAVVLGFALVRPHELPELIAAAPAAGLVLLLGLVTAGRRRARSWSSSGRRWRSSRRSCCSAGWPRSRACSPGSAGSSRVHSRGRPRRLLRLTVVVAAVTTAVLSLDATVVLLTPVVLATAGLLRVPARPHVTACAHLANSASLLLPVSNLTNLLAFAASGLSFTGFAAVMAVPWLIVVGSSTWCSGSGSAPTCRPTTVPVDAEPAAARRTTDRAPRFALVVLGVTLVGFGVSSLFGVEPVWVALLGALVARRPRRWPPAGSGRPGWSARPIRRSACSCWPSAVVVQAVAGHGLGAALAAVLPTAPTLGGLLLVAALAAVLSNLLNNLPATLLLLAVLGDAPAPGVVLAVLIGVNIGPNLSYVGSLATLLWRRVLNGTGAAPGIGEFTALGVLTVPPCLVGCGRRDVGRPPLLAPLTPPARSPSRSALGAQWAGSQNARSARLGVAGGWWTASSTRAGRASSRSTAVCPARWPSWSRGCRARRPRGSGRPSWPGRRTPGARHGHRAGDAAAGPAPRPTAAGSTPGRWRPISCARSPSTRSTSSSAARPRATSAGPAAASTRYERSFLAGPADVVLIGWPVRSGRAGAVPLPALADDPARLRAVRGPAPLPRRARIARTRTPTWSSAGSRGPPGPAAARSGGRRPARELAAAPVRVRLGPEQLSLVEYADTTLPLGIHPPPPARRILITTRYMPATSAT